MASSARQMSTFHADRVSSDSSAERGGRACRGGIRLFHRAEVFCHRLVSAQELDNLDVLERRIDHTGPAARRDQAERWVHRRGRRR